MHIVSFLPSDSMTILVNNCTQNNSLITKFYGLEGIVSNRLKRTIVRLLCSPKLYRCFRFSLFKDWGIKWERIITKKDSIIVANAHMYYWLNRLGFLYYAKKQNIKVILYFSDKVELFEKTYLFNIAELKKTCDLIVTYNKNDAAKYNIPLANPIVWDLTYAIHDYSFDKEQTVDVFFVGSDKGRNEQINLIYDKCIEKGLKCLFYIVNSKSKDRREGIVYLKKGMDYKKILEISSKTKAIVNLLQKDSSGITSRDSEAFSFGTFIITNNKSDELSQFLNSNQIIDINKPNWESRLNDVLNCNARFEKKNNPFEGDYFYIKLADKLMI